MRSLISDVLIRLGGFLIRRPRLEKVGRRLTEWGVQVFLPDIKVRFDWSGVDHAKSKHERRYKS